jgi:hypothetical protein
MNSILNKAFRSDYFKIFKEMRIIPNFKFYRNVLNSSVEILRGIVRKLEIKVINEERQYFEDHDDPPIPNNFKTFQFVEYDNYMTIEGLITLNLTMLLRNEKYIRNQEILSILIWQKI